MKYTTDVEAYVKRWREKNPHETLYLLHPDHAPAGFKEESDAKVDSTSLISAIDNARVIKSSYEVDLLRKACEISSLAHLEVLKNMGSVTNERHIESLFIAKCMWHDAKKQAYGVIAASGANASTLHYIANEDNLDGREMMLLDAGCEWKNYCSDVTRTFPISGKMSKAGKEVYKVVDDMQKACLAITKPGTTFRELQELSMREGIKGLLNLKVLKGEFKDILESGVGSVFYPHGLGHHIGLETHDVSSTATPRTSTSSKKKSSKSFSELHITDSSEPFKPGMVITVEPGIYFNVYALEAVKEDKIKSSFVDWDVVNKYIKVGGVRIEDDVLITEDGHETLTKGAPKGEEACKIVRESRAAAEEKRAKETKRKTSYMSGW